jgi:hypothetical protein
LIFVDLLEFRILLERLMNKVSSFRATLARFRDTPDHFSLIEQSRSDVLIGRKTSLSSFGYRRPPIPMSQIYQYENSTFHYMTMTSAPGRITREGDQRLVGIGSLRRRDPLGMTACRTAATG